MIWRENTVDDLSNMVDVILKFFCLIRFVFHYDGYIINVQLVTLDLPWYQIFQFCICFLFYKNMTAISFNFLSQPVEIYDSLFIASSYLNYSDSPLDLKVKSNMVSDLFSLIGEYFYHVLWLICSILNLASDHLCLINICMISNFMQILVSSLWARVCFLFEIAIIRVLVFPLSTTQATKFNKLEENPTEDISLFSDFCD